MWTRRFALVSLVALGGCATSGTGVGTLQATGKPGDAPGSVEFDWRADADATHGTISATLPDGRVFSGPFVSEASVTHTTELGGADGYGYDTPGVYGRRDGPYWIYSDTGTTASRSYTGRVTAVLEEPGGERMACEFHLAEPTEGPAGGGTGACRLSGGEQITRAVLRGE